MVGISEAETEAYCSIPALWSEATDALVDNGGVGMLGRFGVDLGMLAKVPSLSAIVGDCSGECT